MNRLDLKKVRFTRRRLHIRRKISGSKERLRLNVFRSAKHIYAQIINDIEGITLCTASTMDKEIAPQVTEGMKKVENGKLVGSLLAKRALEKNIKKVSFDRNGYLYHGRVKALADAAREAGLEF